MPALDADEGEHPRHPRRHRLVEAALGLALAGRAGTEPGGGLGERAAASDDLLGRVANGAAEGHPFAEPWFDAILHGRRMAPGEGAGNRPGVKGLTGR